VRRADASGGLTGIVGDPVLHENGVDSRIAVSGAEIAGIFIIVGYQPDYHGRIANLKVAAEDLDGSLRHIAPSGHDGRNRGISDSGQRCGRHQVCAPRSPITVSRRPASCGRLHSRDSERNRTAVLLTDDHLTKPWLP
jgi:hypothetical protein